MAKPVLPGVRLDDFMRSNASFVELDRHYDLEHRSTQQRFFERYHSLLMGFFYALRFAKLDTMISRSSYWFHFSFFIFQEYSFPTVCTIKEAYKRVNNGSTAPAWVGRNKKAKKDSFFASVPLPPPASSCSFVWIEKVELGNVYNTQ
jgi:hypothetical protein